jgi:SprT-like family
MTIQTRIVGIDPTKSTYFSLVQSYDFLNNRLFAGRLPHCLVTLQRKANCNGYFAGDRFATRDGAHFTDEIALNPSTFKERSVESILSTLAHEMVHLEQHHFGKPGKGGYHNKEWGDWMKRIGLKPVSIDQPGKETGAKVTHEIIDGGMFYHACADLVTRGITIGYVEAWSEGGAAVARRKLKVKYTCQECGTNCWAKPDAHFICGECDQPLEAEELN